MLAFGVADDACMFRSVALGGAVAGRAGRLIAVQFDQHGVVDVLAERIIDRDQIAAKPVSRGA